MQRSLDDMAARLVHRLEGARRSYLGNPERARAEFRRICSEYLDARRDEGSVHAAGDAFARREILETFLPRYANLATRQNDLEDSGFGFGIAAEPLGRVLAFAGALLALFLMLRLAANPMSWPFLLVVGSFPFWPDMAAFMYRNQFQRRLEMVIEDMRRIDEHAQAPKPMDSPDRLH